MAGCGTGLALKINNALLNGHGDAAVARRDAQPQRPVATIVQGAAPDTAADAILRQAAAVRSRERVAG